MSDVIITSNGTHMLKEVVVGLRHRAQHHQEIRFFTGEDRTNDFVQKDVPEGWYLIIPGESGGLFEYEITKAQFDDLIRYKVAHA